MISANAGTILQSASLAARRRLPVAGHIRPGIKVLTRAAQQNPALVAAYDRGLAQGLSFDEIGHLMSQIQGCPKYPLTPKNVPYFSVRPGDFNTPGTAQAILDRHGSVRPGDPQRRLYEFPIVFPSDDIDLVFREGFEAWKASELLRWSEVSPVTDEVLCMKRPEIQPDPKARRRWGGRPTEVDRICDPNDCTLFGMGDCSHHGTLNFWVPGATGVGTIELSWTSVYASLGVIETLEMVKMGLGRISGLLPNGAPIFWITKKRKQVRRINWETGRPEKSEQWIIQLEAAGIDMMEILSLPTMVAAPALAAPEAPAANEAPALAAPAAPSAAEPVPPTPEPTPTKPTKDPEVSALRKDLSTAMKKLGWDTDDLQAWVVANFGSEDAAQDAGKLRKMLTMLAKLPAPAPIEGEVVSGSEPAPAAIEGESVSGSEPPGPAPIEGEVVPEVEPPF